MITIKPTYEELERKIQDLENKAEFLQIIFDTTYDWELFRDIEGKILYTNSAFEKITGYKKEDLLNGNISEKDFVFPDDLTKMYKEVEDIKHQTTISDFEFRILRKDKTIRTVNLCSQPVYKNGEFMGIRTSIRDITNSKSYEELKKTSDNFEKQVQLAKENENLLRNVTDNIPAFVAVADAQTLHYKFVNQKFITGFGKKKEEIIGFHIEKTIGKSNTEFAMKYIEEVRQGKTTSYVNTFNLTEGKRYINVSYVPGFDEKGEVKDIVVLSYDITDIKRVEEELRLAKEEAEESNRLKTAFLQNMSHEVRTPMNAIIGFSNLLENPDLSFEKRKNFTSILVDSTHQLATIISDILTISSLETHQESIQTSEVCINAIVVDLLEQFRPQAVRKNIPLYTKQPLTDRQAQIYTDQNKIIQILNNLVSNALKFTSHGFIEIGYQLKSSWIEFYVKDTGIGIEKQLQEKIFERFRQADLSMGRKYGGTGLGLSISKGFSDLLGGQIWVESELGKGSVFYFTVLYRPIFSSNVEDIIATILVAEDEDYNYLFIEEMLTDMQFRLIHTKDGEETINVCKENPDINLILMDIKMPVLDGYSAAKRIKEFRSDLIIIAQSAYVLDSEREKYKELAFDDYITKPISENELKQKLFKYLLI